MILADTMEISLQGKQEQQKFLHDLELCRVNGDVVQSYKTWMGDNQPELKHIRYISLGLSGVSVGVGLSVWNQNNQIGKPAVLLGGATAAFTAASFWVDRPAPAIELAFVESFVLYLEQRHVDAMDWMEQILVKERQCFASPEPTRSGLAAQRESCESAMYLLRNASYPTMTGSYNTEQIMSRIASLHGETSGLEEKERRDRALYYCNSSGRFANPESAKTALVDLRWLIALPEAKRGVLPDGCEAKIQQAEQMLD